MTGTGIPESDSEERAAEEWAAEERVAQSQGKEKTDMGTSDRQRRILLAKPGLDGHDRGVKVLVLALREAGFEVIYTGLRQSVEEIIARAKTEEVDCVGLSILSGSHLPLCEAMQPLLAGAGLSKCLWIVGGNIPAQDRPALEALGVHRVFPTGSPLGDIVGYLKEALA